MNFNHDFRIRVVQHAADATWTPPGEDRRMLDQVGDESALVDMKVGVINAPRIPLPG